MSFAKTVPITTTYTLLFLLSMPTTRIGLADAFLAPVPPHRLWSRSTTMGSTSSTTKSLLSQTVSPFEVETDHTDDTVNDDDGTEYEAIPAVRAPLKFVGPYMCLGLEFPNLATASQRSRNVTGISLDFVLDTAANINTINGQVAKELDLEVVDEAPPGVSAAGPIPGGNTFLLGDCQLEGLPEDDQFTFMEGLTASALPVASPAAAGLLSLPFFHCFEGGVEFQWNGMSQAGQQQQLPPSVTFYGTEEESEELRNNMTAVAIEDLPVTHLPCVQLIINGVKIPALFDTGSPITVLNSQAAEQAGVKTPAVIVDSQNKNTNNPFAGLVNKFQTAQATAQAAARGEILTIAGAAGERVNLLKSEANVDISLPSCSGDEGALDFGSRPIYVGNIPGLAALNALGDDAPPAAVLGMDILRSRPKMLLLAKNNKVYF